LAARDTQERLNQTPEQRTENKPYGSQGINNPIVKFGKIKAESNKGSDGDSSTAGSKRNELSPTHSVTLGVETGVGAESENRSGGSKTRADALPPTHSETKGVGADINQTKTLGNSSNKFATA